MKNSIQKIEELIQKKEEKWEEDLNFEFECLVDWIQGHDGGLRNSDPNLVFWQLGGLHLLLRLILDEKLPMNLQNHACLVVSESLRNEPRIQLQAVYFGAFRVMPEIARSKDEKNRRSLFIMKWPYLMSLGHLSREST